MKPMTENECVLCYKKVSNPEEVSNHKQEQHSPDSFDEQLVEDRAGSCHVCKKIFSITDI
jgi:hypothetical protein